VADNRLKVEIEPSIDSRSLQKNFKAVSSQSVKVASTISKNFDRAFSRLSKPLRGLNTQLLGIGSALASVFATRELIRAANQQEDAVNRLNSALQITGKFSEETSQSLQDFASSLQQVTKFGDEAILEAQALIQSLGNLSEEALKDATVATLDLAAALKIDLQSAATLVGKAAAGEVGSFGRYGVAIKKAETNAKTFERALTALEQKFGGAAQKELGTFSAATQQLSNTFGDLTEELGFIITKNPVVLDGVKRLNNVFKVLGDIVKTNREELISLANESFDTFVMKLREARDAIKEFINQNSQFFKIGAAVVIVSKLTVALGSLATAFKALNIIGLAKSFAFLLNPLTLIAGAIAGIAVGFKRLADAAKEAELSKPLEEQITKLEETISFQRKALEEARKDQDGFLNQFAANIKIDELSTVLAENITKLADLRAQRKAALAGTPEDNVEIKEENQTLLDDIVQQIKDAYVNTETEISDNGQRLTDLIKPSDEEKESIKQSYVDIFGFLRLSFDNTAKSLEATGKKIAAQFKQGVVRGIAGGIQNIVQSLANGENAFQNFGVFVLQVIADLAIQLGTTLIAAGIGIESLKALGGAAAIAAGAALVAVGALIKSFVGGGIESGGSAVGSAGGGGGVPLSQDGDINSVAAEEERTAPTTIIANISGPVVGTDRETAGLALVDLLQEAFDNEGVEVRRGSLA